MFRAFSLADLCLLITLITYLDHTPTASDDPALSISITKVKINRKASKDSIPLSVIIMSRTRFRVNLHSIVA